jgi:hypothetical protein
LLPRLEEASKKWKIEGNLFQVEEAGSKALETPESKSPSGS